MEDFEIGVRVKLVFDLKNTEHRKPGQPDCEGARLEVMIHLASKSPIIGTQHFMRDTPPSVTSFDLKRGDVIAPPPRSKNWDDIITVSTRPVSFSALRFSPTPQRNQENYPNTIYHFSENETHVRSISEVRQASNGALGPADKARTELVISGIGYKRLAEMLNEGTRTSLALKGNGIGYVEQHPNVREMDVWRQAITACEIVVERIDEGAVINIRGQLGPINRKPPESVPEVGPEFEVELFVSRADAIANTWNVPAFVTARLNEQQPR